jgi:multidrug efflux pump subunit AcrA (membrane-fusion protein)
LDAERKIFFRLKVEFEQNRSPQAPKKGFIIMNLSTLLLAVIYFAVAQQPPQLPKDRVVLDCRINLNDQVEVPAQEPGVIREIFVINGQTVKRDDPLVQLDDSIPRQSLNVANANLLAAEAQAKNQVPRLYAEASMKVAKAELATSEDSNRRVPGTVVEVKMNELRLKVEEMRLSIEKAKMDTVVAERTADVKKAEKDASITNLEHRLLKSSMNGEGEVREVRRHVGEWAQAGETVVHIVQMNILRAEGLLKASDYARSEVLHRPVMVEVELERGRKERFSGEIVYADPLTRPGNGTYVVRAEIKNRQENGDWLLHPGATGEMTIQLK